MTENRYHDFFSELKYFIIELGIDYQKIVGCSDHEIVSIENKIGTALPGAYKNWENIKIKRLRMTLI